MTTSPWFPCGDGKATSMSVQTACAAICFTRGPPCPRSCTPWGSSMVFTPCMAPTMSKSVRWSSVGVLALTRVGRRSQRPRGCSRFTCGATSVLLISFQCFWPQGWPWKPQISWAGRVIIISWRRRDCPLGWWQQLSMGGCMRRTRGCGNCLPPPHTHTLAQAEAHSSGTTSLPQSPSGRR